MAGDFTAKFQIKPGHRVMLLGEPPEMASLFSDLPDGAVLARQTSSARCDVVFLFARSLAELDATLGQAIDALTDKGELWVARYKKASRVETDLLEPVVRERGRLAGLEDVMVRAIGPNWSALKFRRPAIAASRPSQTAAEYKRELLRRMNAKDLAGTMELIADDAVYFWSNGVAMFGKPQIAQGMQAAFEGIQNDLYEVRDLTWLVDSPDIAVAVYRFQWTGEVDGKPASGRGRGASVIKRIDGQWRTVHENLSQGAWRSPEPTRAGP